MNPGFLDRVHIFSLRRNLSNRTSKADLSFPHFPDASFVPCRIIRGDKVLFPGLIFLSDGDTILDLRSGDVFEIRSRKILRGFSHVKLSSYRIRPKPESGYSFSPLP